ncbi:Panacea domain-containing protein [Marivita sp.]|uniref:Panacea domain-containing protein n=1 Tax=Marivita sp. TaxID=2003365 RepID=UPI003B524B17
MSTISDVAAYFCAKYPHKSELSKTRLTKLVYLADWEAAKHLGRQITDIRWYFHNFGPYVDDVVDAVQSDDRFEIVSSRNYYGDEKLEIKLKQTNRLDLELIPEELAILDSVIEKTRPMYWNAFIKHVYSTDPIEQSDRYRHLDLVAFANESRAQAH